MGLIMMGYLMYRTIKSEEEVEVKEEEEEEVFQYFTTNIPE
jgi:CRISPR/Cas system-associated exonuclease Cas4 (RecB family)